MQNHPLGSIFELYASEIWFFTHIFLKIRLTDLNFSKKANIDHFIIQFGPMRLARVKKKPTMILLDQSSICKWQNYDFHVLFIDFCKLVWEKSRSKIKKKIPWVAISQTVDLDFMLIYMHISRSKAGKWKVSYNNK